MIQFDAVHKRFPNGTTAVHDLSLEMPEGGVNTGLGGAAARGTSPMPWLAIIAGGGFLAAVGMIRLRRTRSRAAHAAIDR